MATSGSRNFLLTRDDIILAALSKLGAVAIGSSPTSAQTVRAASSLNAIVKSLHNYGVYLWEATAGNFTVTTSQTTAYAIGADVVAIDNAYVRVSGYDTPIKLSTLEEFMVLSDKDQTGQPTMIRQELTLSGLDTYVWPTGVTGTTYTIYFTQYKKLQDFDAGSDDMALPTYWTQALIYALAFDLAPEYGIPLGERDRLEKSSVRYLGEALGNSRESGSLVFRPNIHFRG